MNYPQLTFEQPDCETFRNLDLAFEAMALEGTAACALNAANEVTVQAFLEEKIGFLDIAKINEATMRAVELIKNPKYDDFVAVDAEARKVSMDLVGGYHF